MPGPVLELPRGSAIEPLHSALVVPYLLSEETVGMNWKLAMIIKDGFPTTPSNGVRDAVRYGVTKNPP